jgi:cyclophilin family peptidyl-prolyl cis-trans isomerase
MGRSARFSRCAALAFVLLGALSLSHGAGEFEARLELSQQFYYTGDSLEVRVSVRNQTGEPQVNPIRIPFPEGFKVRHAGKQLQATGQSTAEHPDHPKQLGPGARYGTSLDLAELFPQFSETGVYEIYWSGNGVVSDMVIVTVIPPYDPAKRYRARIETDSGTIAVDLLGKQSPIATKAFVDLAHAGFYDGMEFSEVRADDFIVGGDPLVTGRPKFHFPAEPSAQPLVTGTVILRPMRATPPANGSTFVILLRPQPGWSGQVTVLGQVAEGLDVVKKLSQVPSTMRSSEPFFKPLETITIRSITIESAADGDGDS